LIGTGAKSTILEYTPSTGNGITLTSGANHNTNNTIIGIKLYSSGNSTGSAVYAAGTNYVSDFYIDRYEIEGFKTGIYIPFGLEVHIGFGRLIGQGKSVSGGVGVQLGNYPSILNVARLVTAYSSDYETNFVSDGSVHIMDQIISENCINAIVSSGRLFVSGSWIQADTYLYTTRAGGQTVTAWNNYHLNGSSAEQDDLTGMVSLGSVGDLAVWNNRGFAGTGRFSLKFATTAAKGLQLGANEDNIVIYNSSSNLVLHNNGYDGLFVDNTGRVGVGAVPTYPFDVSVSKAGDRVARFYNSSATGSGLKAKVADDTYPAVDIENSAGDVMLKLLGGGGIQMKEQTDLTAPVDNNAVLYLRDNGAGKTQLVVRFPTGAIQQIAIEP
jgi:hypothetical protein